MHGTYLNDSLKHNKIYVDSKSNNKAATKNKIQRDQNFVVLVM